MRPLTLLTLLCCVLLQGCAQVRPLSDVALPALGDVSRFGPRPDVMTVDALHTLRPAQEAAFLEYFRHPSRAYVAPHQRLYQYLENKVGTYRFTSDTLTASEVLTSKGGNCLSLAILTTALAQLAGIEIRYQLMDDRPVYEYQGSVVIRGVHISAIVVNPQWESVRGTLAALSTSPGMRIDYFPELRGRFLANLDRSGYLALYYDNIASNAIADGNYDTAYWNLLESLRHAPDRGASLNMLAVVNRRKGDFDAAISYYRRVLQLAPYMHEVHLGMAQAYYEAGELRRAENELTAAVDLVSHVSTRNLYKAKLQSLREER